MLSKVIICPHNRGVDCNEYQQKTHCNKCGWNPDVAKERQSKLRGESITERKAGNAAD